jgi:hypothetical protein
MKKSLKKLHEVKERIEEKVEEMTATFDERSEKWQESEKGEMFQERIDNLELLNDSICQTIDDLEDWIDNV